MPGKEVIESLRACLIVIVAVVRGKEVDISNYLNRAEDFGNKLATIKLRKHLNEIICCYNGGWCWFPFLAKKQEKIAKAIVKDLR